MTCVDGEAEFTYSRIMYMYVQYRNKAIILKQIVFAQLHQQLLFLKH